MSTLHEPVNKRRPNTNTHMWTHKYEGGGWLNRTILLYQLLLHFLGLESHSEGDQAGGGGSRRGCDGRQGSSFQPVLGPAGNGDIIRSWFE